MTKPDTDQTGTDARPSNAKKRAVMEDWEPKAVEGSQADLLLSSIVLHFDEVESSDPQVDAGALLAGVQAGLNAEKIDALIESCQRECLQTIIRPLGIGRVLFDDKDGGNVDTTHNVRKGVYATGREQNTYKNRGEYNSDTIHKSKTYIKTNKDVSEQKKLGNLNDSYTGGNLKKNDDVDLDHVISGKQTHDDPGRVLAEVNTETAANLKENLRPTHRSINRSKKAKSPSDYANQLDRESPQRLERVNALKNKEKLTEQEKKELKKLEKISEIDTDELREVGENAQKKQDSLYNTKYYTSKKFWGSSLSTSSMEGGKMALQQSVGVLMEEFVRAVFAEIRDVWTNGFKEKVDDRFFETLKKRLLRVAQRVAAKFKDATFALRDGFISGFLSNLVTVLINAFVTTAARIVRLIREGFMSLYRAVKTLAFPEEGMTLADAADAALKIFATGVVAAGGITLEGVLEAHIEILGPAAPFVSAMVAGIVTGIGSAFAVYLLDQADFFGVQNKHRQEKTLVRLEEMIDVSHQRALQAASVFDPLILPSSK